MRFPGRENQTATSASRPKRSTACNDFRDVFRSAAYNPEMQNLPNANGLSLRGVRVFQREMPNSMIARRGELESILFHPINR